MTKHLGEPISIVWISVASASGNSPAAGINNLMKQARAKGRPIVIAGMLLDVRFRDGIKEEPAKPRAVERKNLPNSCNRI
jgi:hypothetical protein